MLTKCQGLARFPWLAGLAALLLTLESFKEQPHGIEEGGQARG